MTQFYLNQISFEKWVHQNGANYTGNFVDGCLLDNFIMDTRRGYAFFYEHYLNTNSSNYKVTFVTHKAGRDHLREYDEAWSAWYIFQDAAEEEEETA